MKVLLRLFYLTLMVFLIYGCATIISGSKQELQVASSPSDAKVTIDGESVGNTPLRKDIKRKKDNVKIEIEMEGYETYSTTLNREFNSWYIGNLVFGGVIGLIVDPITGAIYKLSPEDVNANLREKEGEEEGIGFEDSENQIFVKMVHKNKVDSKWEKIGQMEMKD